MALDALLEGVSRKDLAAAAEKMSAGYRQGATSQAIATPLQAKAYAVSRMPATYAACAAVFARLSEVMPGFAPASLLDVGAGTGAASWAAVTAWPGISSVTMLDRNPALRDLARKLADAGLPGNEILSGDVTVEKPKADLVVASYVLAEFPEDECAAIAAFRGTKIGDSGLQWYIATATSYNQQLAEQIAIANNGGGMVVVSACPTY